MVVKQMWERVLDAQAAVEALTTENAQLKADMDYMAMMADIDIDEEEA